MTEKLSGIRINIGRTMVYADRRGCCLLALCAILEPRYCNDGVSYGGYLSRNRALLPHHGHARALMLEGYRAERMRLAKFAALTDPLCWGELPREE